VEGDAVYSGNNLLSFQRSLLLPCFTI